MALLMALAVVTAAQALTVFPDPIGFLDLRPVETTVSNSLKGAVHTITLTEHQPGRDGMRVIVTKRTFDTDGYETAMEKYTDGKLIKSVTRIYEPNHQSAKTTTKSVMTKYVKGPEGKMIPSGEAETEVKIVKSTYDTKGLLVKEVQYQESGQIYEVRTYSCVNGRVVKCTQTDAQGTVLYITTYTRDQYGNLISTESKSPDGMGFEGSSGKTIYDYATNTMFCYNTEFRYSNDSLLTQATSWKDATRTGTPVGVLNMTYTFDAAGNWITRNTIRKSSKPEETITDTREITYYPAK